VFLNIVLDEAVEEKDGGEKVKIGMVIELEATTDESITTDKGHGTLRDSTRNGGGLKQGREAEE
ncbi:hypothetical protein E4U40_004163, partial [Claviceps sp. LM458 group G5]